MSTKAAAAVQKQRAKHAAQAKQAKQKIEALLKQAAQAKQVKTQIDAKRKPGKRAPIYVTLPNGQIYKVGKLLSRGDSNAKLKKNGATGEVMTVGMSFAASDMSGYDVCLRAYKCKDPCLVGTGHARAVKAGEEYSDTNKARIARTIFYFEFPIEFREQFFHEIYCAWVRARKAGKKLAVRLNMFSDMPWEQIFPELFEMFPDVMFYDYTKIENRMRRFLRGKLPKNYHLTFSRDSVKNEQECFDTLDNGGSVSVVFDLGNARTKERRKPLPQTWHGWRVVSGDETDLRYEDERGVVIGLYAKRANQKAYEAGLKSGFFVVVD